VSRYAPLGSGPQRSLPKAVHPFSGTDIWELLSVRADRTPSKPFLIWHPYEGIGRVWTYAEFHRDASAIAASLRERCVTAGDLVAIHLENKPELVLTLFACAALQAPAVLVNTRFSADELQYCMENARAAVIVTQSSLLDVAASSHSRPSRAGLMRRTNSTVGRPTRRNRSPCSTHRVPRIGPKGWSGHMPTRCGPPA
jgi:acyl-CoA synthetase (AMP-forming)/AMP-acid ligase II